jgi:uncharacterized membrane protein
MTTMMTWLEIVLLVIGILIGIGIIIATVAMIEYLKFNKKIKEASRKDIENQLREIYDKKIPEQKNL